MQTIDKVLCRGRNHLKVNLPYLPLARSLEGGKSGPPPGTAHRSIMAAFYVRLGRFRHNFGDPTKLFFDVNFAPPGAAPVAFSRFRCRQQRRRRPERARTARAAGFSYRENEC